MHTHHHTNISAELLHELWLLQLHGGQSPYYVRNFLALEVSSLRSCRLAKLLHELWLLQLHGGQGPSVVGRMFHS